MSVNDLPSHPVITIDGPAASGKSSVARLVAARLGFIYVNTGNMYRAMSWAVLDAGIDATDAAAVRDFAARVAVESMVREGRTLVGIGGRELSDEDLNSDAVNGAVSHVASVAEVRAALVAAQRDLQKLKGLVMEGRDIGSVVFPESTFKFYIDACEAVRSARRQAQGHGDQVAERDRIDSTRKTSPLVVPEGAEVIDNSYLTLEQAVERVMEGLQQRGLNVAVEGAIGGVS